MRKKKIWTHKKFKKHTFTGTYERTRKDRVFQLASDSVVMSFESPQAAKKAGWVAG